MARYRLVGGSIGNVGVQFERKDDDREIARRVVNLLADRRMLWKDFSSEIEEHCIKSSIEVRRELGVHLDNPNISDHLADQLRLLQRLFRSFIDELDPRDLDPWGGTRHHYMGTDPMSTALGRLRGLVGVQLGTLASHYDLDLGEDLATIVPAEEWWFFERFTPDP